MAKETIRERGQRIWAELDLVERHFPAKAKEIRRVNDLGESLVFAMQAGAISALTEDGKEYVDEFEADIRKYLPEVIRIVDAATRLVEKAHDDETAKAIIATAARRFGDGWNLRAQAELLAANGIDWSGACRIAS